MHATVNSTICYQSEHLLYCHHKVNAQINRFTTIGILYNDTEELRPFAWEFYRTRTRSSFWHPGVRLSSPNSFEHVLNSYQAHSRIDNYRRNKMMKSFKDFNWLDWVVAPEGYKVHYCYEKCNFPLMHNTNHAIMQSIVDMIDPYKFPQSCCSPTLFNNMYDVFSR